MPVSPALAFSCRCVTPLKQLLTFALLPHCHRFSTVSSAHSATTPTFSCSRFRNPNFITGNPFFSRMERFKSGSDINKNKAMVGNLQQYGVITSKKLLEKNLHPGMHALDIGSGTGYLTACFALMVGPQGRAVGVEHIPELVSSSIQNIQKSAAAPLFKEGSLSVHVGDGRLGWSEFAPYDAIHVGAAAAEIPQPLIDQLKPGGRLIIPVGNVFQDLQVVDKNSDGTISIRSETSVRYVPLTSRDAQLRGS
ncbi:Protein-L-isoaspartate O-methyltransferase [Quillaja saponaria]|uniref:Protein-L-isoaspartate O-methyltransferase n=1 Tax=Quillaja saponaria TaxID=32244 RepID=A0AAD7KU40_QUISA|nr:Protein-L-isoaspartate O-methyltransferase [Quillaja saponaria]